MPHYELHRPESAGREIDPNQNTVVERQPGIMRRALVSIGIIRSVAHVESNPKQRDDRLTIEVGPYGTLEANPYDLWSDPADSPGREVQEAINRLRSVRYKDMGDVPPEFR